MIINRWNTETHEYEPTERPADWTLVVYSMDMDLPINCCNCGMKMTFGDGYTSKEWHTPVGFGYPVCDNCYHAELHRDGRYGV